MRTLACLALASVSLLGASAGAEEAGLRKVIIEVETLSQPSTLIWPPQFNEVNRASLAFPFWFAFHAGDLDLFDIGGFASSELTAMAKEGQPRDLNLAHRGLDDRVVHYVTNSPSGTSEFFKQEHAREFMLDPARHRFLSYLAKVRPSDDAFVGNDDPQRFEIFDAEGRFKGPVVIDVYGHDVLDAGVRANDETEVGGIHYRLADPDAGTPENEPIRLHPGHKGSHRNPGEEPLLLVARTLGPGCQPGDGSVPSSCWELDPESADFTQPGYRLARIRITSGLDVSWSGHWYDPARSGEGFSVQLVDHDPPLLAVAWYTYQDDDSGEPEWLFGAGPIQHNFAEMTLYRARGGRLGWDGNPANVEETPWGTLNIGFASCTGGRVFYTPNDPELPAGDYFIRPALPPQIGTEGRCGPYALQALDPDEPWFYE